MTPFDCILNPDRDIIFFTHGLTGHRVNWLRIFVVEARNQERLIVFKTDIMAKQILGIYKEARF